MALVLLLEEKVVSLQQKIIETYMIKKITYCTLWSVALFVSTFYSIIGKESVFTFDGKLLLDVTATHIFPMIMAMTLYLLDVTYSAILGKVGNNLVIWVLTTVIAFMGCFVASLMVNENLWGWCAFCMAWMSLTILKFVTTEGEDTTPYIISED